MSKKVLLPFDSKRQLQQILPHVLNTAVACSAEVVLLRVNLPTRPSDGCIDRERLYSELKALQAQLSTSPVFTKIETSSGPAGPSIFRYAEENRSELVFIAHLPHTVKPLDATKDQAARDQNRPLPADDPPHGG
jgi:hypothetical protein